MRITCLHGYFFFREQQPGEVAKYNSRFGQDLTKKDDYYTFAGLVDAPSYSIALKPYLGIPATSTFAGNPWEVMEKNNLVYDFQTATVRPSISIVTLVDPVRTYDYFTLQGLIQPGSLTRDWDRIVGYTAEFDTARMKFSYSELFYAN
jgi:hypothetical protein